MALAYAATKTFKIQIQRCSSIDDLQDTIPHSHSLWKEILVPHWVENEMLGMESPIDVSLNQLSDGSPAINKLYALASFYQFKFRSYPEVGPRLQFYRPGSDEQVPVQNLDETRSSPMVCEICKRFSRVPHDACNHCEDKPCWHHGNCCYQNDKRTPTDEEHEVASLLGFQIATNATPVVTDTNLPGKYCSPCNATGDTVGASTPLVGPLQVYSNVMKFLGNHYVTIVCVVLASGITYLSTVESSPVKPKLLT